LVIPIRERRGEVGGVILFGFGRPREKFARRVDVFRDMVFLIRRVLCGGIMS
jgi:hypothetical protein